MTPNIINNNIVCCVCKEEINHTHFLKCSICANTYDLNCTNVSVRRFDLMRTETKASWKCRSCLQKRLKTSKRINLQRVLRDNKKHLTSEKKNPSQDNATLEQPVQSKPSTLSEQSSDLDSYSDIESQASTLLDASSRSLPNITVQAFDLEDLKSQITELSTNLASAHEEIDRLNSQVVNLKRQVDEKTKLLDAYKKILTESASYVKSSAKNSIAKKRTSIHESSPPKSNGPIITSTPLQANKKLYRKQNSTDTSTDELKIIIQKQKLSESKEKKNNACENETSSNGNILIFGSQQCVGLAKALINSRQKCREPTQEYKTTAFTKPQASTEEILKNPYTLKTLPKDKIILCLGENDTNPTKVIMEISAAIKHFQRSSVFILGVHNNKYLNVNKLNQEIRILCNNSQNCYFINVNPQCFNKMMYLRYICNKVNHTINEIDNKNTVKNTIPVPVRRGTIPFYFRRTTISTLQKTIFNLQSSSSKVTEPIRPASQVNMSDFFRK